jgi:hypothetical protein
MTLHNFNKEDYININEIGASGYILEEDNLLLSVGLNVDFSLKDDISHLEQRNIIDRLMKSCSKHFYAFTKRSSKCHDSSSTIK